MYQYLTNPNLTIIKSNTYRHLPLITPTSGGYYPYIQSYLKSNQRVMDAALSVHHRTLAVRVDLHFPELVYDHPRYNTKAEITCFIESFKAKVNSEMNKRQREGKRVHPCTVRYIWICEGTEDIKKHYHVVLFLNNDTYRSLGCKRDINNVSVLVNMIVGAWQSALNVSYRQAWHLVHIPHGASYRLKQAGRPDEDKMYCSLFKRLSYFTKVKSKTYGIGRNCYGCSRK